MDLLAAARRGFDTVDADPTVRAQALGHLERWLTVPEFTVYRPQIERLIAKEHWAGLIDRFYQILPFGTGGRRGAVGIGPNRMNPWTLTASVQGHCDYLKLSFPGRTDLRVVLAYDVRSFEDQGRNYDPDLPNPVLHLTSRALAQQAACVYAANGIQPWILPENSSHYQATPELSFTIRLLNAQGGLNISASHNPPDDNGGKFYDDRGAQTVPPDDQIMADLVEQVAVIKEIPWSEAVRSGKVKFLDDGPHCAYLELIRKQSLLADPPRGDDFLVVFTPLHGVGHLGAMKVLELQGFRVAPVEEQMTPDGQFPFVTKSPNPEVSASMDRAEALARKLGADLVLATDPDADRLGGMVPDATGEWHVLDGNTLVALITHFKLEKLAEAGLLPAQPIVLTTLVTTSLIGRIARSFGCQVVDNLLVGFKNMAEVLRQLEVHGCYEDVRGTPGDFVLACEESHGVLTTPHIRDKDAAGGCLLLAELALDQKRRGRTMLDYLDALERRFGCSRTLLRTVVLPGIEGKRDMARMMDRLRSEPPRSIGGLVVTGFDDLWNEEGWKGPFKGATDKAARNFLLFRLGENARIALRPSGTEPKAKAYVEVCSPPCGPELTLEEWRGVKQGTAEQARTLADDFLRLCGVRT